jgi:hypothetical protein
MTSRLRFSTVIDVGCCENSTGFRPEPCDSSRRPLRASGLRSVRDRARQTTNFHCYGRACCYNPTLPGEFQLEQSHKERS